MTGCGCAEPGVFGHHCWQQLPVPPVVISRPPEFVKALCIDGPARGDVITVPASSPYYYMIDTSQILPIREPLPAGALWTAPDMPLVTYQMTRFGFVSGNSMVCIRIASSAPGEPDARDLADLLLSDAAKAALMPLTDRPALIGGVERHERP